MLPVRCSVKHPQLRRVSTHGTRSAMPHPVRKLETAEILQAKCHACKMSRHRPPPAAMSVLLQVNELAFTRDGKLFMQATSSGVEVRQPPACHDLTKFTHLVYKAKQTAVGVPDLHQTPVQCLHASLRCIACMVALLASEALLRMGPQLFGCQISLGCDRVHPMLETAQGLTQGE